MPELNPEHILQDVKTENAFWFHDGPVVRNIYELLSALQHISQGTFSYHVNYLKNDISDWVRNIIKDKVLADTIVKVENKKVIIKKIKKRIGEIEKELEKLDKHLIVSTQTIHDKQLDFERVMIELIITFVLGLVVGLALGVLIDHYGLIPTNWF